MPSMLIAFHTSPAIASEAAHKGNLHMTIIDKNPFPPVPVQNPLSPYHSFVRQFPLNVPDFVRFKTQAQRNIIRILTAQDPASTFLGQELYCLMYSCTPNMNKNASKAFSPQTLKDLYYVNQFANTFIKPAEDAETFQLPELWVDLLQEEDFISRLKKGRLQGECDEYVLLKRELLIALGYPSDQLRLLFVETNSGEGHLVLEFQGVVLDNLHNIKCGCYIYLADEMQHYPKKITTGGIETEFVPIEHITKVKVNESLPSLDLTQ